MHRAPGPRHLRGVPRLPNSSLTAEIPGWQHGIMVRVPSRGPRPRADAALNREAILAAALAALAESADASLNSIAKRAGVANATLYRHFPTRESLILAVYRQEVAQVVEAAELLLAEQTPVDALANWVERLAQYAMTKHGLAEALRAATGSDPLFSETYDSIVGALNRLLVAAQDAGQIRKGLDPNDVILALAGLWEIDPRSDWRAKAQQLYSIVFTGLRA
jgi:AcrR family transcriptional regulator